MFRPRGRKWNIRGAGARSWCVPAPFLIVRTCGADLAQPS